MFGSSPLLIAAYHVFHRLLAPRHPPVALNNLLILVPFHPYSIFKERGTCVPLTQFSVLRLAGAFAPAARQVRVAIAKPYALPLLSDLPLCKRTRGPCHRKVVEANGFEPMTPCLQGRCSPS